MNRTARRVSYAFLCVLPFLDLVLLGLRPLRAPGLYQALGGILFAAIAVAAWTLGVSAIASATGAPRKGALAGALLILPVAIMSLLWIGIGAPFQATTEENYMRFLVLVANSILVASAFVVLKEVLHDAGERLYATVGFATSLPAGVAYLFCTSMSAAVTTASMNGAATPRPAVLGELYGVLEFVACVLTYITTAMFAKSLAEVRWLGRGAARAYVIASAVLVALVVMSGVTYPEISSNTAPWYTRPGVIARIPAVPWTMPYLLGVVVLRRAGMRDGDGYA
jgi:hypothetical protein